MNVLDAGLFWFLFIALCVVGVCPDKTENNVDSIERSEEEGAILSSRSHAASNALLLVLAGLTVTGGLYWQFSSGPGPQVSYSAGIATMKQYEGSWRFMNGQELFPDNEDSRSFTITPLGRDGLLLKGVTGNFTLSLSPDGPLFTGLLFMVGQSSTPGQYSARIRFSPGRDTLTMAVVNFEINGRRDIMLQGKRIENQSGILNR
jgi:hypothetical protein